MHRNAPRLARRRSNASWHKLACAAVALPVLLVAGCSSDSDGGDDKSSPSSSSSEAESSPSPAKFKKLPDACKGLAKGTVSDLVPGTDDAAGERLGSGDTQDSSNCFWWGLKKYDYRQLTVALKRFDSDSSLGSGDKQAQTYLKQQVSEIEDKKGNKEVKDKKVDDLGDAATTISYKVDKKGKKDKSQEFRAERLVAQSANAVIVVDYEGTGYEGGDLPSADDLNKGAQKAAKESLAKLK